MSVVCGESERVGCRLSFGTGVGFWPLLPRSARVDLLTDGFRFSGHRGNGDGATRRAVHSFSKNEV